MPELTAALTQAAESAARATADLEALAAATTQAQESLTRALRSAQRAAALSAFDQDALKAFLEKPYLTRPLGEGQYELIVPTFIGFRAGWPVRHTDAYSVFLVSKFIHFINPLPDWLAGELGFGAPAFSATLEGNALTVTAGDAAAVAERLGGSRAIARREGATLYLRPASRFDILRRIIREEGFLPFTPRPVPAEILRPAEIARTDQGKPAFTLRPHQARDYQRFLETGAVSVFAYPQTGKSYVALQALAELRGPHLVLAPRRALVEQWQARLGLYLTAEAAAEVTVATYQSARKHLNQAWTLVVFDEAHHMPADFAIESAAAIHAVARMGLSATPRREDGQEDLIPALTGFPVGADWPVRDVQRPHVTVWLVRDESAKLRLTRQLCARPADGKTFVFTFRLDIGKAAARALDVPFVFSGTKRPLDVIREHDTVVISSVGNEGLSFPVRRVVEIDFLYGSRQEAGQRLGRLAYEIEGKHRPGEHHVLMTADEYQRYGKRLLMYEQWGLEVDVRTPDSDRDAARPAAAAKPRKATAGRARRPGTRGNPAGRPPYPARPVDEIDETLALPAVAAKVAKAEAGMPRGRGAYVRRVLRYTWQAAFSPSEIAEGLGTTGQKSLEYYRAAFRQLRAVGLVKDAGGGRYQVDQGELNRLRALSALGR